MNDHKIDPVEYAREVLWQLSGIRAEIRALQAKMVKEEAHRTGKPAQKILDEWLAFSLKERRKIYFKALREAGIPLGKSNPKNN